ncbi:MAG: SOS response-associated peptidase [Acidimicrobiales bacterium]|nr:SOS response-associated peptidase [Acidimicrobiales bacterium]
MCGRFASATPPDRLARYFDAALGAEALLGPSYNVAPTNDVYVVVDTAEGRTVEAFHWGLVPIWAEDLAVGNRMINARGDTLATKPAFRSAFQKRRCLVPADGFYEWRSVPGQRRKQPYYIHRVDGEPLAFAGLWEVWRGPDRAGDPVRSTTIVTTDANDLVRPIHDRMPVILPPSAWDAWLDPDNHDTAALGRLLVPAPPELLLLTPVSTAVNNVRNEGPELIEPDPEAPPAPGAPPSGPPEP